MTVFFYGCGILYNYKVVQIWPGLIVYSLHTNDPGHIWTTLYMETTVFAKLDKVRFVYSLHTNDPGHIWTTLYMETTVFAKLDKVRLRYIIKYIVSVKHNAFY